MALKLRRRKEVSAQKLRDAYRRVAEGSPRELAERAGFDYSEVLAAAAAVGWEAAGAFEDLSDRRRRLIMDAARRAFLAGFALAAEAKR